MNKMELKYGLLNNYSSMKESLISLINYLLIWTYTKKLLAVQGVIKYIDLFPLNRTTGLWCHIEYHPVNTFNFLQDSVCNVGKE